MTEMATDLRNKKIYYEKNACDAFQRYDGGSRLRLRFYGKDFPQYKFDEWNEGYHNLSFQGQQPDVRYHCDSGAET